MRQCGKRDDSLRPIMLQNRHIACRISAYCWKSDNRLRHKLLIVTISTLKQQRVLSHCPFDTGLLRKLLRKRFCAFPIHVLSKCRTGCLSATFFAGTSHFAAVRQKCRTMRQKRQKCRICGIATKMSDIATFSRVTLARS